MAIELSKFDDIKLKQGLEKLSEKVGAALLIQCGVHAQKTEAYMKINRKWTDRTGYAKQRLTCKISQPSPTIIRETCAHGVEYGKWLELAHGKRFAIIAPTIQTQSPKLIEDLSNFMSKIKVY